MVIQIQQSNKMGEVGVSFSSMPKWPTEKYTSIMNSLQQTQFHIQILAVCRCLSLHECSLMVLAPTSLFSM